MEFIGSLLEEYLFLIPLVVLFLCECTKVLIAMWRNGDDVLSGRWLELLFKPGGIPSTHSAFVTSLLIIIGRKETMSSTAFAITFVFASIVWYDAMSVRQQVGKQGKILNRLQNIQKFSERLGHSFIEILAGIAFGAVVTIIGIWIS